MPNPVPYGEDQEPYWRSHDNDPDFREKPRPARDPGAHRPLVDPDWDDSHWFAGERYWLGQRYYRARFWQSIKSLFHSWRGTHPYPDSVVADEVCEALAHEPEVDMTEIQVSVNHGHVTVSGRAVDHWMKQQVEDVIYFLPGVNGVTNNIEVKERAA